MAGTMTSPTAASGTVSTNESLNTLGGEFPTLITGATFAGFSDDEAGDEIVIPRTQASAPSSVANDVWHDTTLKSLRYYDDTSAVARWNSATPDKLSLKNNSGATRASGDTALLRTTETNALNHSASNSASRIIGVILESTANGDFGLIRCRGVMTVNCTAGAAVVIGDFIKPDLSVSGYAFTRQTVGLAGTGGACGIALTNQGAGTTVTAYLWGDNSQT